MGLEPVEALFWCGLRFILVGYYLCGVGGYFGGDIILVWVRGLFGGDLFWWVYNFVVG